MERVEENPLHPSPLNGFLYRFAERKGLAYEMLPMRRVPYDRAIHRFLSSGRSMAMRQLRRSQGASFPSLTQDVGKIAARRCQCNYPSPTNHSSSIVITRRYTMLCIGQPIPALRTPAFRQGALMLFDFAESSGHWLVLCGHSNVEQARAEVLDHHREIFWHDGALLLTLCPNAPTFHSRWFRHASILLTPLLTDPLSRLHRLLNLPQGPARSQCCSVLIDPFGFLRMRLIHSLNGHEMNTAREALLTKKQLPLPPTQKANYSKGKGAIAPSHSTSVTAAGFNSITVKLPYISNRMTSSRLPAPWAICLPSIDMCRLSTGLAQVHRFTMISITNAGVWP